VGLDFLSPAWLLAIPPFLGLLTLLYFLKLKRRQVTVASTFLWQQALDDMRVNSPFQRLRMNLLLLLQALALLLALLALARPVSNIGGLQGTDSILLIDVSASMLATDADDAGTTRFARAQEEAIRIIDDLSLNDRAIVVAFSDEVAVQTPMTESKSVLREAVEALEPTHRPTILPSAIERVRLLLDDPERDPSLYVFSDGRVGPLEGVALEEDIPLHFVRLGSAGRNVGITGVDVRLPSGLGEGTRVLVSVVNHVPDDVTEPVEVGVDFYLLDDDAPGDPEQEQLLGSTVVSVPPRGVASVPFESLRLEQAVAQNLTQLLRIELDAPGGGDAQPTDDVAWAVVRPQPPIRVLLVTSGNLFLANALAADPLVWTNPRGEVPMILPGGFDPADPALLDHDLIVLDRFSPPELPPGSYLIWGAAPPFEGFEDGGPVEDVAIVDWEERHPVARFVNFATLALPKARRLKPREGDVEVVRSNRGPMVVEAREGDRNAIVCGFDLLSMPVEGAWTFDPSFPIFLANAIRWLGGGGRDRKSLHLATGATAELHFPSGTAVAEVTRADAAAEPRRLEVRPGDDLLRVPGLDRSGLHFVQFFADDEAEEPLSDPLPFAVNAAHAAESDVAPAESLELEGREVEGEAEATETNRDLWKLVAAIALVLVLAEWWIYNRRVFI